MKYLKKYENLTKNYKDYLVWEVDVNYLPQYYIFKFDKKTPNNVFLFVKSSYLSDNNYERKDLNFSSFKYSHEQVNNSIIFQSNYLIECEEYIERILTQNKFNL
jgi:hypothetical protein